MIMGRNKKQYIGAIEDESEAALIYDWHAVVTQGIKVRTQIFIEGGGVPDLVIQSKVGRDAQCGAISHLEIIAIICVIIRYLL